MLSIARVGRGNISYYTQLAETRYYRGPFAEWFGSGATALGLSGSVDSKTLAGLMRGFGPDGARLVQNAGMPSRRSGWDLTFSAPKSVSILYGLGTKMIREAIERAHEEAVKTALQYLETTHATTRRGKDGVFSEPCGMVVSLIRHAASRLLDPQLHDHALVLNIGYRQDGSFGTLESRPLYRAKMVSGALYRAELAYQLGRELGLVVSATEKGFEIVGVPSAVIQSFSKRRQEILSELSRIGASGAVESEKAALKTRSRKAEPDPETLATKWREEAKELGFSLANIPVRHTKLPDKTEELLCTALDSVGQAKSAFSERDLLRSVTTLGVQVGVSGKRSIELTREALQNSKSIVPLGASQGEPAFSTVSNLRAELRIICAVKSGLAESRYQVPSQTTEAVIRKKPHLTGEQQDALRYITSCPGSVQAVSGLAGTGKTALLEAARLSWERSGFETHGLSVAGKAAQGLEEGSGISSETVACFLLIEQGSRRPKSRIGQKTVVVLDEASMVSTQQLDQVISICSDRQAKLVLVGDERQLPPIEAGKPFQHILGLTQGPTLREIVRQKDKWARDMVGNAAAGKTREVLEALVHAGALSVEKNAASAREKLIRDWKSQCASQPESTLILAPTKKEVEALNELAQGARKLIGRLSPLGTKVGKVSMHGGDRVLFTKNDRELGVKNGNLGTLVAALPLGIALCIRLDGGRHVIVPRRLFEHLTLGYAVTCHKAQGTTVDRAYILMGPRMLGREMAYVQLSRAREQTLVYTDRHTAGERLEALSKALSRSEPRPMAIEVMLDPQRQASR